MDDPSSLLSNAERSSDRGRAVLAAIAGLPSRLQKLLKLRFFDRLSYAEIAKKTKLSKGNVGFLLNKATTTLRKKLNNARRDLNEV
jgi:RNA polymerase sigma factor (sigma-70 family)